MTLYDVIILVITILQLFKPIEYTRSQMYKFQCYNKWIILVGTMDNWEGFACAEAGVGVGMWTFSVPSTEFCKTKAALSKSINA